MLVNIDETSKSMIKFEKCYRTCKYVCIFLSMLSSFPQAKNPSVDKYATRNSSMYFMYIDLLLSSLCEGANYNLSWAQFRRPGISSANIERRRIFLIQFHSLLLSDECDQVQIRGIK